MYVGDKSRWDGKDKDLCCSVPLACPLHAGQAMTVTCRTKEGQGDMGMVMLMDRGLGLTS